MRVHFKAWLWVSILIIGFQGVALAQLPDLQFTESSGNGAVVDIRHAGDQSGRLFLVEQNGRVVIHRNGVDEITPFLDIEDRVLSGGERGLLSLAFAPDYAQSGLFYIWYTNLSGYTVLSRFSVSADADVADPGSEQILLTINQPASNHNGGRLHFGPDGYLYLSTGDGGNPQPAQRTDTLLGKILRLDVAPQHTPYGIPPDNPFVDDPQVLNEIWALGLRNPWRTAFDRKTGDFWIADVGQNTLEEINVQPAASAGGENYGWNIMEGTSCYTAENCDMSGLTLPVFEYDHTEGCSITGGEIYRGHAYPGLKGHYLFGDACTGIVGSVVENDGSYQGQILANTGFSIVTFGQAENGSVYLSARGDGVYLISDGPVVPEPEFVINAGLNDAWYNPATAGQGFFITVFPDMESVFLAWFTFDTERPDASVTANLGEPGHRWLTAFGSYQGNTATLKIEVTSGGVFDAASPAPVQNPDGTIILEVDDCQNALLTFDITPLELQGEIPIQRIALDNVAACEAF